MRIGVDTPSKPFPRIVHENAALFRDVKTVLDIGAGRGRFVQYFLTGRYRNGSYSVEAPVRFSIERYVAVEPCRQFCTRYLKAIGDDKLEVICARLEDVRTRFRNAEFDMVIFWDVLMFINANPYEILEEVISIARKWFLFSLHPVKNSTIPHAEFRKILAFLDAHPRLCLIAKANLNRVYAVR